MSFYTYTGNASPEEHTSRIILRGGNLVVHIGEYADFTDAEIALLGERFLLEPGTSGLPAAGVPPGLFDLYSLLAQLEADLATEVTARDDGDDAGATALAAESAARIAALAAEAATRLAADAAEAVARTAAIAVETAARTAAIAVEAADRTTAIGAEATTRAAADVLLAPIASPTFTGDPKAPTPAAADNDTSIATTAWSQTEKVAERARQNYRLAATGEDTYDRLLAFSSIAMTSGFMRVTYFKARSTETITKLLMGSSSTAAAATPTLVRMGIYSVASDWALTALLASTANDTALFSTINTEYLKSLSGSWSKVADTWYALGLLVVSGAAVPTIVGNSIASASIAGGTNGRPRLGGLQTGLSDLPASASAVGVAASGISLHATLVP